MSILDWLLILAVVIGLFFAIRYMVKNRGRCCSGSACMGNCSLCRSGCCSSQKKKEI